MLLLHARRFQWLPLDSGQREKAEVAPHIPLCLGRTLGHAHIHPNNRTLLRLLSISPTICVYFIVQVHLLPSRERRVITIRRRRISRIIIMLIIIRATSSPSSPVLLSYLSKTPTIDSSRRQGGLFPFLACLLVCLFNVPEREAERGAEHSPRHSHMLFT